MGQSSNLPRRAYQRRNLQRDRNAASIPSTSGSKEQPLQVTRTTSTWNQQSRSGQGHDDRAGSDTSSDFDSESDEEYGKSHHAAPRRTTLVRQPPKQRSSAGVSYADGESSSLSDSNSDSDDDSGYCSLEEDTEEKAEYYDALLERFRTEGPTLANHGENTKRMEDEQVEKWNK